jgi:hypothetical protein
MRAPRDRTLLDLTLVAVSLFFLGTVLIQFVARANADAEVRIVESEALQLFEALVRFEEQNGYLPGSGEGEFDRAKLEPLRRRGYYTGSIAAKLVDGSVDAYVASPPSDRPGEFWMELTLGAQPETRFLLVRSDDAPLGGGVWREGVYLYRGGTLNQVRRLDQRTVE